MNEDTNFNFLGNFKLKKPLKTKSQKGLEIYLVLKTDLNLIL